MNAGDACASWLVHKGYAIGCLEIHHYASRWHFGGRWGSYCLGRRCCSEVLKKFQVQGTNCLSRIVPVDTPIDPWTPFLKHLERTEDSFLDHQCARMIVRLSHQSHKKMFNSRLDWFCTTSNLIVGLYLQYWSGWMLSSEEGYGDGLIWLLLQRRIALEFYSPLQMLQSSFERTLSALQSLQMRVNWSCGFTWLISF